ncbi:Glycosyl_hydrolase family 25 protein [Hexamita inflata]|uniref:Glycosyl hydrolase family 25 protein n=1 Tax=Hexamita inflata TaxID=28002 RepID=A0AA86P649_9EUKA|nr:Glycosyl hydrolase family 25 protein [Hexamita inflata]CAI9953697.1 Glycosyl hydrolase family 25 protein [Hexamita inflata]CAI9965998.1 Glycosyl hydrolase family 25 protein [Hexamita inflata]
MLLTAITLQTRGFDVSYYQGAVSQDTFNCLHNNGYSFAIIQAQIGSTFNANAISDYQRAKAAGIQYIDFYIFPTTAKDARGQVRDTIQRLQNAGVMNGNMIWLDVESIDLFYPTYAQNQNYISAMLSEMSNMLGANRVGVYSNWVQWQSIVGNGWTGAQPHQIWYPHYDNWQSFADFQPFGGWTKPSIKQYQGDQNECGTALDRNFY